MTVYIPQKILLVSNQEAYELYPRIPEDNPDKKIK